MQTKPLFTRARLLTALASTCALTLTACGGGSDAPDLTPTSSLTQGRWLSTGLTPAYTAIVVPASTGANTPAVDTVWALAQDASTLIKLKASGPVLTAGAVTGNVYMLGTSNVTAVSGASYTIQTTTGAGASSQMAIQPLLGTTALFDRSDAMATALRADQANGTWQADLGSARVNWTVQSAAAGTNNLSGTSTTGCTYSGHTSVVSAQSLYTVQFTETCPGSGTPSTQTFHGVATLSTADARLTVVATNEAETRAAALLFAKQP
ncbi:hypothetical protein [Hydrogenophaga defluvii]|uniref:Lipoprotein n=1 Tax=Hydrogenophaga defluvii TaxID=249410 RepID=A0ABW2SC75_9BURK